MAEAKGDAKGRRGKRREGRGLVSVLLGTALLGVLGFGLGVVAGLVLEEPGLLLDYLTGRTTSARIEMPVETPPAPVAAAPIELADEETAAAPATPPAVSAPPPELAAEPVESETAPAPVASPPPVVAAAKPVEPPPTPEPPAPAHADQSGYSVQVGALADSASAEQLAAKLEKRGYAVYVKPSPEPGANRWRVRVGPVATREEAQRLASQLEREKLPTWVLAEGRR